MALYPRRHRKPSLLFPSLYIITILNLFLHRSVLRTCDVRFPLISHYFTERKQPETGNRLEGRIAIVTGGASGIGASTVRLFSENGAKVIIADIRDDLGRTLAEQLGSRVSFINCNVSVEEQVRDVVDTAVAEHGRLDIMYNNAGIIDRFGGSILDSTASELDRILRVNHCGAFYGAKHAARVMGLRRRGCIPFTTSSCTSPVGGLPSHPYVMSKYGIMGLVKNLSAELGQYGVRVNCISPSGVITRLSPFAGFNIRAVEFAKLLKWFFKWGSLKGQRLTPESVARAALYLASDDANFVTGHNLVLDGGQNIQGRWRRQSRIPAQGEHRLQACADRCKPFFGLLLPVSFNRAVRYTGTN